MAFDAGTSGSVSWAVFGFPSLENQGSGKPLGELSTLTLPWFEGN